MSDNKQNPRKHIREWVIARTKHAFLGAVLGFGYGGLGGGCATTSMEHFPQRPTEQEFRDRATAIAEAQAKEHALTPRQIIELYEIKLAELKQAFDDEHQHKVNERTKENITALGIVCALGGAAAGAELSRRAGRGSEPKPMID